MRTAELSIIHGALGEVSEHLRRAPMTARIRELRARVATYERVVSGWSFRPPTPAQCAAMLECVMEIHSLALAGQPNSLRAPIGETRTTRPPPNRITPSIQAAQTRTTRPPPRRLSSSPPSR